MNRSTYSCHHTIETLYKACYAVRNGRRCEGRRYRRETLTTPCFSCITPPP